MVSGQPDLSGGAPDPRPYRAGQRRGRLPDLAPVAVRRRRVRALAGPYAQIGETDNWGASAYFHHLNATGGIDGHKIDYIVMNNQSSASQSELIAASQGTSAQSRQTAAGLKEYFAGLKAAGYTGANQLDNSQQGWDAGLEINTLGIVWARTPANYENISAMEIIAPDGTVTLCK